MNALNLLLLLAGVLLALPVLLLLVQTLAARLAVRAAATAPETRPPVAILVPAHDEATTIAATVEGLLARMQPDDRLLVVADNCSDDTAAVARAAGAEVAVRQDASHRGKGYALDFGLQRLAEPTPPAIVVIVDADCTLAPGSLDLLAHDCARSGRPVQGLYLMHAPQGAGLKTRIAAFAWLFKNLVRALGYRRLGLPCQLMGSGMAFPWPLAQQLQFASGEIVEDLKLGLDAAARGHAPLFCPEAVVSSEFPTSAAGLKSQRTRWEHGHLAMLLGQLPRLAVAALQHRDLALFSLVADAAVPPLALLVLMLSAVTGTGLVFALAGGSTQPALLGLGAFALLAIAILLAWQGWGRHLVTFGELLSVPFYVLSKLPLYAKFLIARQKTWVRTDRR